MAQMQQNPLADILQPRQPGRSNPMQMVTEFRKFAQGMTPEKAQQQVCELLKSGKMSQQQHQELQQQAKQFMSMFGLK